MKRILTVLAFALLCINLNAATSASNTADKPVSSLLEMEAMPLDLSQMSQEDFLSMTPKKYKEMTGKRMGVKKALQLKAAQKIVKRQAKGSADDMPQVLYIILAIFGLAWIIMGIKDGWDGNNWWVNLILSLLFILPGLIHALIVMDDYYP